MNIAQPLKILSDSDQKELLKLEQVKLLYAAMPASIVATTVIAVVLVAVVWDVIEHGLLTIWLSSILVVTFARLGLTFFYHRASPELKQTPRWERCFNVGSIAAGIIWGCSSLLLFSEASVSHQVFLAFMVGGVCAGAVTSLSPLPLPILSFLLLALGPVTARFFTLGSELGVVMGSMLLLFLAMISVSAHRTYHNIKENVELRMQSQLSEAALAESEERFRELFEGNRSVELIIDPDSGEIVEANRAAERFYGYSNEQLLVLNISDINTLSEKQVKEEMALAKSERRDHFIFQHRLANGEIRDVEVHSGPIHWRHRKVLYSHIYDISERKHAEHFIKQTSEILEMIATGKSTSKVYDAIALMYEARHPGMRCSMLELKGRKLMHGGAPSLPKAYCDAVNGLKNGPEVGSCGTSTFTGKRVLVEDIATDPKWADIKDVALPHGLRSCWSEPIKSTSGKVLGAFGMYYNHPALPNDNELNDLESAGTLAGIVMEREHRKETLNKFSQAIEQAGESIIITDKEGTIEYVNPSFTRITGYASEEVLGKNPRIIKSGVHSVDYYEKLWSTITNGKIWHASVTDRRKDGSQYPGMMSIAPIFDDGGQITHYVGIQQDMTDHEMLEDKFRQAQKMEALGTLVGGIAHDFNNMLAGMTGNLYLAKKKVADRPDVLKKLISVEELSYRAAEMIKQLLAFARKDTIEMKPFGLTSFIQEVSKLNEASIPENIRFRSEFCPEELVVKGDATQLQQVLMNLLNNAHDAVSNVVNPTITMTIDEFEADDQFLAAHSGIDVRLFAHLVVKDNGSGISDESKEHIFEPFYTTKEIGTGTGLGLAMSYGAIESHGGILEVESEPGEGASFHIYLPLLEEKKIETKPEEIGEALPGKGELILIVDDNADVRATSREVLESLGYRVLEASDGLQAVDLYIANQKEIALTVMDIVMPRLGGVQTAQRIEAHSPDAKVVFATGYDKDESLKSEMPSEEYVILSKPYNAINLSQVIRDKLDS
ncbi:MAG: PAS domain S-box protein [Mariprofundaceae bacterium]